MSEELETISNIALYKKGLHTGLLKREEDNILFIIKGSAIPSLKIAISLLSTGYECALHNNFYAVELKYESAHYIFTGFEIETLSRFKSWIPVALQIKELSTSSVSFGILAMEKSLISFTTPATKGFSNELLTLTNNSKNCEEELEACYSVPYKSMFDLPLNLVTKASIPSKGDVALEFTQPDFPVQDVLCGMRLSTSEGDAIDINDYIQEFAPRLKITEKPYLQLEKIFIVTPRGRFSFLFYDQFVTLEGTNKQFKIPFRTLKTIVKVQNFKDKINIVIELNPAISIRQTMYQYMLIEFESGDYLEGSESDDENEVKEAQPKRAKVERRVEYLEKHEKFLNELKNKTGKSIIEAGDFIGQTEINGVTADFKTNNGVIYFLDGYVLFLQKPVILLHKTEIRRVELLRWNNYISKTFDMRVYTPKKTYDFGNIEKTEMTELIDYFVATGVFIDNVEEIQQQSGGNNNGEDNKRFGLVEGNLPDDDSDDAPIDDDYIQNSSGSGSSSVENNAIESGSE